MAVLEMAGCSRVNSADGPLDFALTEPREHGGVRGMYDVERVFQPVSVGPSMPKQHSR